jgi:hypothetical protein
MPNIRVHSIRRLSGAQKLSFPKFHIAMIDDAYELNGSKESTRTGSTAMLKYDVCARLRVKSADGLHFSEDSGRHICNQAQSSKRN